jgi:integrase
MPAKSTQKAPRTKPKLPKDFPLYAHGSGQLAKRINGKTYYFGSWSDPGKARQRYLDEKDDLYGGRVPASRGGVAYAATGPSIKEVCDAFYEAKSLECEAGDIAKRTLDDYDRTAALLCRLLDKHRPAASLKPIDFQTLRAELARTRNPNTLSNEVQRIRTLFKWATDSDLLEHALKFGPSFKRAKPQVIRKVRQEKGSRLMEPREIRRLLRAAPQPLKAMLFLAINGGIGNADLARLRFDHLNLQRRWLDLPRGKTGVDRRVRLWPETCAALSDAIARRRKVADGTDERLVFITRLGRSWADQTAITHEVTKLLKKTGLYRNGRGLYDFRHICATIGCETGDSVAVGHVLGHISKDMLSAYNEGVSDDRLDRVCAAVRRWLLRRDSLTPWRMTQSPRLSNDSAPS